MAFKPSQRRNTSTLDLDLDIKPVMNLMVVLIPLLLAGAEFVKLAIIEINLPPQTGGGGAGQNQPPKETEKKLNLSITITKSGFTISSPSAVLPGEEAEGPTVPLNQENKYDYAKLKEKLAEVKDHIKDQGFRDKDAVIITASAEIEYEVIISVLDEIGYYEDDEGELQDLFPQISFGRVI